jgi:predicted helicase
MSQLLIQKYLNDLSDLRRVSGSQRESVVREAFKTLLKDWGRGEGLLFVPEDEVITPLGERRYVDGALVEQSLRLRHGYWEAKDTNDDLDEEIAKKFRRGYPQDNIIFEDSQTAVLIQNKREVLRCAVDDADAIQRLVAQFFKFQPEVIQEFRKAVEKFREDLPAVLGALRETIDKAERDNPKFKQAAIKFLKHAQETINPSVTAADVREMLIQHILTEEIFNQVFDNSDFHHNNNVAKELYALEGTFFTGGVKRESVERLKPYYAAIKRAATSVPSHQEKQKFLKVIYENFYQVYNRKAADRLGVAYTPNEIVRFMIESADWLCQKHFNKRLIDKSVEILDPATGTGTFIVDLLEHFRGQKDKLRYKYLEELHANEVAILPYYVANLNIEATYAAITGEYLEYPNLCFVDTLDNVAGLRAHGVGKGQHFGDLLGGVSAENVARIKRQNARRISVIVGNPPYNANQANANEDNKNREYPTIDRRIKETYIAASKSQKTKRYDMYSRFFRWASDRLEENGVLGFITNRNFLDSREADGFRKVLTDEFNEIFLIDLGGDVREDPRISGTKHNVFGIQTGVVISMLVRRSGARGCRIRYSRRPPLETASEKLGFISGASIGSLPFQEINPTPKHEWLNLTSNDFEQLVPVADKQTKLSKTAAQDRSIFKLFSLGVVTNRDDWVYGKSSEAVGQKTKYLIASFNAAVKSKSKGIDASGGGIKWTRAMLRDLAGDVHYSFDKSQIIDSYYRPFTKRKLYFDRHLNEMVNRIPELFGPEAGSNRGFGFSAEDRGDFSVIAFDTLPNKDLFIPCAAQVLAQDRFFEGKRLDNITDWALEQFRSHYASVPNKRAHRPLTPAHSPGGGEGEITKDAIFHYVYGVLHDPVYREKYALNLKREFPRIPFYAEFWTWADWGKALMALHIGYEKAEPWPLERVDTVDKTAKKSGVAPKALLKARRDIGAIELDGETQLTGVPQEAWEYRLGNRSALEWILDQYKEKTPKDPTIREKLNTYRFADYKDHVIDLLKRVTRVSVETMKIIEEMKAAKTAR